MRPYLSNPASRKPWESPQTNSAAVEFELVNWAKIRRICTESRLVSVVSLLIICEISIAPAPFSFCSCPNFSTNKVTNLDSSFSYSEKCFCVS